MKSKITGGETTFLFKQKVLNKYDVSYHRCNETGFVQTEEPHWLGDAYSSAITKLDIGLPYRNLQLAELANKLLIEHFNYKGTFLDYAGGYGLFTRLMRDKGFNFYHTDKYCQNLFAEHFELNDAPIGTAFEMVTAFEVFEHLPDPLIEIQEMLKFSDNLLFTTELQPTDKDIKDWHYLATETGQHIAFYNTASLGYIAKKFGYNYYTDGSFVHLFSKKSFEVNPLAKQNDSFLVRKAKKLIKNAEPKAPGKPESLLLADWQSIRDKLNG